MTYALIAIWEVKMENCPSCNPHSDVLEMEKYTEFTEIDRKLRELLKIRSFLINGCAFCINMHTIDALFLTHGIEYPFQWEVSQQLQNKSFIYI